MRRQQGAVARGEVCNKDVGIRALGLLLRVDDVLAVFRPDGTVVSFVLRGVGGEVLHFAHHHVVDVDFVGGRRFRFNLISQVAAVGRPCGAEFRDFAGLRKVDDFAGLGRDRKMSHCSSPS